MAVDMRMPAIMEDRGKPGIGEGAGVVAEISVVSVVSKVVSVVVGVVSVLSVGSVVMIVVVGVSDVSMDVVTDSVASVVSDVVVVVESITPEEDNTPIRRLVSVNQIFPSGSMVISMGLLIEVGMG